MKTVYKLVYPCKKGYLSFLAFQCFDLHLGRYLLNYEIGKKTVRPNGNLPLMAFETVEDIESWIGDIWHKQLSVLECEARISKTQPQFIVPFGYVVKSIQYGYSLEAPAKEEPPTGTIFCGSITPIKDITNKI